MKTNPLIAMAMLLLMVLLTGCPDCPGDLFGLEQVIREDGPEDLWNSWNVYLDTPAIPGEYTIEIWAVSSQTEYDGVVATALFQDYVPGSAAPNVLWSSADGTDYLKSDEFLVLSGSFIVSSPGELFLGIAVFYPDNPTQKIDLFWGCNICPM
jgi:hypothetical protein